jgi:hypothetical protein
MVGLRCGQFSHTFIWSCVRNLWWFSQHIRGRNSKCASHFLPSWEKCCGDPHNDSTSLRGPNIEMVRRCFNWRWTHRETHKLHYSWNCWTNSRARPSGLMSDHSWHCWGGGNWLWDMSAGSDIGIGHALVRTDLAASPWHHPVSHFTPHPAFSGEIQMAVIPPYCTLLIWHPVTYSYFQKQNWSWKYAGLIPLRRSRPNRRVLDNDSKGLPGSIPKMEEAVGPVSTCGREILWGWWRPIGLMVSFMIFTAAVRNILDTTTLFFISVRCLLTYIWAKL